MRIRLRNPTREVELSGARTVNRLLDDLELSRESHLVIRNDTLVPGDARLEDDDEAVGDEAVRVLSAWPDRAVADHLLKIAKDDDSLRHQVLAIRGLVRLAGPQADKPANLEILTEVINLAKRPQEKRLALGVLGGVATPESLAVVAPAMEHEAVAEQLEWLKGLGYETYVADPGVHGSSMLNASRVEGDVEATWKVVLAFLAKVTKPGP